MGNQTAKSLAAAVADVERSPIGVGTLEMIVRRPGEDAREILAEAELSNVEGVVGDSWNLRASRRTQDGSPHPDMQLNLMNWRAVKAIAPESDEQRALAGDQLYVDLALGADELPTWTTLSIGAERGGTATIQVTDQPHNGCAKFSRRFGGDALKWVNGDDGQRLNLRGINARVVTPGTIKAGDQVAIVEDSTAD